MIGYSVSFCIRDIVEEKVKEEEVERIIGGIRCEKKEDYEEVVKYYRKSYWLNNPELAEAIFWRFYADGKIDQPRVRGERPPNISQGHWSE